MTKIDIDYYRTREQQERDSADRAEDDIARRLHLEMAGRYASLQREVAAETPNAAFRDIASVPTQTLQARVPAH